MFMETKAEYIAAMRQKLMRILNRQAQIEDIRIRFDEGVKCAFHQNSHQFDKKTLPLKSPVQFPGKIQFFPTAV